MSNADTRRSLPGALDAAFAGFEVILQIARRWEDQEPHLFAAFMSAAAADGRDAILGAPSLPSHAISAPSGTMPVPAADPDAAADSIAALAAAVASRLDDALAVAVTAQDRRACQDAAAAARQIHHLMAPADDADPR